MNFDSYLENLDTGELIRLLARAAQAPNEMTYKELEELILSGGLNDFLDFQEKYSRAVNEITPALIAAMAVASAQATAGKIILSDSLDDVKFWLRTHGAELVTNLSAESQKAIANILLMWQEQLMNPRLMAQQLRPLIGLSAAQVLANERYRQNIFSTLTANGMSAAKAKARADKAAIKYASKQHRYRAETILHTELAFAYNQGADMGVRRAIRQGLMNRCAMRWTTAGTNRVCSRCLELKDKIVGYTDEAGVTLPPLHPRCRCSIEYEETGFNFDLQRFVGKPLPEGDYNLTLRRQVQARHIEGTREYREYAQRLSEKNLMPSKLSPDTDCRALIKEFHGKGIYDPNPKDLSPREQVDTGRIIGQYWDKDKNLYVDTTWLEIVYSKRGTHIYPIRPLQEV